VAGLAIGAALTLALILAGMATLPAIGFGLSVGAGAFACAGGI
jgi:hypothetical protein